MRKPFARAGVLPAGGGGGVLRLIASHQICYALERLTIVVKRKGREVHQSLEKEKNAVRNGPTCVSRAAAFADLTWGR